MTWTEQSLSVLQERYCWKEEKTPQEVFRRVADAIAQAELNYCQFHERNCIGKHRYANCHIAEELAEQFYDLMINQYFMPNSPTIMNAGAMNSQCLSACFVLPLPDSIEGICQALHDQIVVQKAGGGTGFTLSNLRPEGAIVKSTGGGSSGPISFLSLLDKATDVVKQAGRRRGANLANMVCTHPDLIKFITSKLNGGITNFNISVAITDDFMEAVRDKKYYPLIDPRDNTIWYEPESNLFDRILNIIRYMPGELNGKQGWCLYAPDVWNLICESAWNTGDPGLHFIERVNKSPANPIPQLMQIETSNPCFAGDTLVWTIYGPRRFDQLVGKKVPVLTEKQDGTLVFRKMSNIRKTKENAPVYEVTIRRRYGMRGTKTRLGTFTATPDHMIKMKNGEWKRVDELKEGDSVQSVYRSEANSKGYYKLTNGTDTDMEHRIIASWPNDKRPEYPDEHVHHLDEDKQNNSPNNIMPLPQTLHDRFNNSLSDKTKEYELVNHKVVSVKHVGYENVYCGSVEDTHTFFIMPEKDGGILVKNCGEQFLEPENSCTLGHLNLGKYVIRQGGWPYVNIDTALLREHTKIAVRFLDNVIDVNSYPTIGIAEQTRKLRRIGLGIMGWADVLMLMGIPYDSQDALDIAEHIMSIIKEEAENASIQLARDRGNFSLFEQSIHSNGMPRRNSNLTTVAPTGTTGFFGDCSSGIEPIFSLDYTHVAGNGVERRIVNSTFLEIIGNLGIDKDLPISDIMLQIPENYRHVFVTAHQIDPYWHIEHQSTFQKYVDNSISKTINIPNSATVEDISEAYQMAYNKGCLGITVYRNGCKSAQVLNDNIIHTMENNNNMLKEDEELYIAQQAEAVCAISVAGNGVKKLNVLTRPSRTQGETYSKQTAAGKVHITINSFNGSGDPREMFVSAGKAGSDRQADCEAIGRLISLYLRTEDATTLEKMALVAEQLSGIGGSVSYGFGKERVKSIPDAIASIINEYLENNGTHSNGNSNNGDLCPNCHNYSLAYQEGCRKCLGCYYSEC